MTDAKEPARKVAVTGASGGIGAALLRAYAAAGTRIYACGRNAAALEANAQAARALGAEVFCDAFDVRDDDKLVGWIDMVTSGGDLDVLIVNQGVSSSCQVSNKGVLPEERDDLLREIDVNARADLLAVNEAVTRMIQRKRPEHHFQVGLMSSMASFTGLPSSPGYSASKACVRVYGQALRRLVSCHDIGITVICPGFVVSPMSKRLVGGKPFMVTAETAASRIYRDMQANRAQCVFPKVLRWGIALLQLVPEAWHNVFLKPFGFTVIPDAESARRRQASVKAQ